ncbi:MAG: hypothetical protein AAB493_01325 [Patescibacteria group bacterium]
MGKKISEIETNGDFLTPNGRKFVLKQLDILKKNQKEFISFKNEAGDSRRESQENEMSFMTSLAIVQKKIIDYQKKLKLPEIKVREQKHECLHGNGVKIKLDGKPLYVVIDGVCVCKHMLPENHAIISANSALGQTLIGKKIGESGSYNTGGVVKTFVVEKIDFPSKAKWVFKYDDKVARLSNQTQLVDELVRI